jgi:hypothetical protein
MNRTQFIAVLIGIAISSMPSVCLSSGIYKLVDELGHVTYTNAPAKGARKLQADETGSSSTSQMATKTGTIISAPIGSYSKISSSQQLQRDMKRRQVLKEELVAETKLLENVLHTFDMIVHDLEERGLNVGEVLANDNDVQQLRSQAILHRRNIQALKRELKNF